MRVENKRSCPVCGETFRIMGEKENANSTPNYCATCGSSWRHMTKLLKALDLLKKAQEVLSNYHSQSNGEEDYNNDDVIDMDEEIKEFLEIKE